MGKEIYEIYLDDIIPNRFQPRIAFDETELSNLKQSIIEHGIIQPLVVRKLGDKYEIIAGERRFKAASLAGLQKVPVIIEALNDEESAEVALIENVQRADLTPIEEAMSYKNILEKGRLTQEHLAKKLGKSQSTVANKLRLLNLDNSVQQALLNKQISERHARSLLKLAKSQQKSLLNEVMENKLTVRQTDKRIKEYLDGYENKTIKPLGITPQEKVPINRFDNIEELIMEEPKNKFDEIEQFDIDKKENTRPRYNFGKIEVEPVDKPVEKIIIEGLKLEGKRDNMNPENNGYTQSNQFMGGAPEPSAAPNINDLLRPSTEVNSAPQGGSAPLETSNLFVMTDNSLNQVPTQPETVEPAFNFGQPVSAVEVNTQPQEQPTFSFANTPEPVVSNFGFAEPVQPAMDPAPIESGMTPFGAIPTQAPVMEEPISSGFNFNPMPEAVIENVREEQPVAQPTPAPVAEAPTFGFAGPTAPSALTPEQINSLDQKSADLQNHMTAINNDMNNLEQMVGMQTPNPTPVDTTNPFNEPLTPNLESLVNEFRQKQNPDVMAPAPVVEAPTFTNPAPMQQMTQPVEVQPIPQQPLTPPQPTAAPQPIGNINVGLRNAIGTLRDAIHQVESLGFVVDVEEFDFEDKYQIVVKVQKNH